MGTKDEANKAVLEFYDYCGNKDVLKGKVWIEGGRVEVIGKDNIGRRATHLRGPLHFEPELIAPEGCREDLMQTLLCYLKDFQPVDKRGLVFFPSAKYTVRSGKYRISLYMQEERDWGQGITIDVFDRSGLDQSEFEKIVVLMAERKISSFALGKLRERREYGPHTVLRRYFLE
jgi:hypothetical protein